MRSPNEDSSSSQARSPAARRAASACCLSSMRALNRMVEALAGGQVEKFVLTHRNQMRAVVVSIDRYSQLEQAAPKTDP